MNNVWYRRVGFYNNPFSIKPAAYSDSMPGFENTVDDISYAILTKKVVFVEGEYGQGKTTLLKKLITDFGGKKQVAYFSCNRINDRLNVERLLKKRYGFLGRLFDFEAKDIVLLLDEAQYLGEEDYKQLSDYHKKGSFKSIVFVSPKLNGKGNGLHSNSLTVSLKKTNSTEAVKIIRQRVGHLHLLSDDIINKIFDLSNCNIRELLKNCEKVCKYAVDNEMTKVTEEVLAEVLGNKDLPKAKEQKETKSEKPSAKRSKPAKKARKPAAKNEPQDDSEDEAEQEEEQEELAETKKSTEKKEEPEVVQVGEAPQEEQPKPQLHEEEDDIDRQVKQMAMEDDDDIDEVVEPKRRRKAEPAQKLGVNEEEMLNEEDYY